MKKTILIVLLIIVVAGVSGGGVYLWQKNKIKNDKKNQQQITELENKAQPSAQTNMATWLSYENKGVGVSFQYPPSYVLDKTYESKKIIHLYDVATYEGIQSGKIIEGAPVIEFMVFDNPNNFSVLEWAKDTNNSGTSNFNSTFNPSGEYKNVKVDGRDAILYSWMGMGSGDTVLVDSADSKYIFNFSVSSMNSDDKIRSDFSEIINTIKFNQIDARILLTLQNLNQYNVQSAVSCNEEFNNDAPSTTVNYKSEEFGISIDVPYNPKWGSDRFKINPYDIYNSNDGYFISFGSMDVFEACGWTRHYNLSFLPAINSDDVISKIKSDHNYPAMYPVLPTVKDINGLEVVEYEVSGFCSYPTLEVIGKKFNYLFSPTCDGNISFFEDIVQSIKLID